MADVSNYHNSDTNGSLSVILSEQKFADMILNFLGKKEKLTYQLKETAFLMRLNDIEQFHYLLDGKISKEHHVHISHFSVNISYSDGSSREISGIEALNKFLETRDVTPSDVTMSWNIIIKYPKSETIENQRIQLSLIRHGTNNDGEILLVIEHTNQSWGIEVLNLFKDKIAELSVEQTNECRFARSCMRFINKYGVAAIILAMNMAALFYGFKDSDKDSKPSYDLISFYKNHSDLAEADIALFSAKNLNSEYLRKSAESIITNQELKAAMIDIADSNDKNRNAGLRKAVFYVIAIVMAGFFIPLYLKKAVSFYSMKSFILISRRSEAEYQQYLHSKNKMEFYSITSIFVSAFCGVLGNFIYQIITSF